MNFTWNRKMKEDGEGYRIFNTKSYEIEICTILAHSGLSEPPSPFYIEPSNFVRRKTQDNVYQIHKRILINIAVAHF